jgi:hypothetical protein
MALMTALQATSLLATDVTWNGTANDGLWSNVNNWEGDIHKPELRPLRYQEYAERYADLYTLVAVHGEN